jgi:hypothetical protein
MTISFQILSSSSVILQFIAGKREEYIRLSYPLAPHNFCRKGLQCPSLSHVGIISEIRLKGSGEQCKRSFQVETQSLCHKEGLKHQLIHSSEVKKK